MPPRGKSALANLAPLGALYPLRAHHTFMLLISDRRESAPGLPKLDLTLGPQMRVVIAMRANFVVSMFSSTYFHASQVTC